MTTDLNSINWDQPGALSIVVQGALLQGNLVETANHCRHWRELFPAAELILAISVSDVVSPPAESFPTSEAPLALELTAKYRHDGHLRFALNVILVSCNKVAFAPTALPLPPIKSDSPKLNNMNFQIEAARCGLALATSRHVLRIRADMIFLNRSFLNQYAAAEALPKGKAAIFHQRVMISWLFTLNPYTNERMPLHFSDWFHFGLTTDVRRLWQVPQITFQDSLYYRTHRHAAGSNAAERLFNIRIAVEQHIVYACFKPHFPNLKLDYHNDRSSIELAMDILLDNFVICDIEHAGCIMDKYADEINDPSKLIHCVTRNDWFNMITNRETDYRITLMPKIMAFNDINRTQYQKDLPQTYGAHELHTSDARILNREIVAVSRKGVLFWGPYTNLSQGGYQATVHVTSLEGRGSIILSVTVGSGQQLLSEKLIDVQGTETEFTVYFDVAIPEARNVEVVCRFDQLRQFAVSGVTFAKRVGLTSVPMYQQDMPRFFGAESLSTQIGKLSDGNIISTGQNGTLLYGPYTMIVPGQYLATINAIELEGRGTVRIKAATDSGNRILAETMLTFDCGTGVPLQLAFDVPGNTPAKLEVICDIKGLRSIVVSGLLISERIEAVKPTRSRRLLGLLRLSKY